MYRGLDVRDAAKAHELALQAHTDAFEVFNISAQSVFQHSDVFDLKHNLPELLSRRVPKLVELFNKKGWEIPASIDRVYVIEKAREILNYQPAFNIEELINEWNAV